MKRQVAGILVLGLTLLLPPWVVGEEQFPLPEKYSQAIKALDAFILKEMTAKEVPGLSIALVDGQSIVWAKGFGLADPEHKTAATSRTLYPLAAASKPITALALVQLARQEKMESLLDGPVIQLLPEFKPINPAAKSVSVWNLVTNRSGLVREAPVGNGLQAKPATRKALVESLNGTTLTHTPFDHTDESNSAWITAARVMDVVAKQPFENHVATRILHPLGINSTYQLADSLQARRATGQLWTSYGRTLVDPVLDNPALASIRGPFGTVLDMAKFIPALYLPAEKKSIWSADDLEKAFRSRAFISSDFDGTRQMSSSGSAKGCTSRLGFLPKEKLGVIVCVNQAAADAVVQRICDAALKQALAIQKGQPLPRLESTTPLTPGLAKTLAGSFRADTAIVEITSMGDRAWIRPSLTGIQTELRMLGSDLVGDDALTFGPRVSIQGDALEMDGVKYARYQPEIPRAIPEKWKGLIGEYGTDTTVVFILEKDGQLHAQVEWHYLYPLEEVNHDTYKFPRVSLYAWERVAFQRNGAGKAETVLLGGARLNRRTIDGEDGSTFRIKPLRPIADIRKEAQAATPPVEKAEFLKPDLVDLARLDPTLRLDIRYHGTNNFMGVPFYASARAFMQRPAAEALLRAHNKLKARGFGILVYDAYRPWYVTKMFWEATPEAQRVFVADPQKGSRHNRGCAIDLTLTDLKTGKPVEMVSGYDEFSDRAYPEYPGGTSLGRYHRTLLRQAMESEGFTIYEAEWWHFDYKDWRRYPILNSKFEELR